jgi:hypothetical protein
MSYMYERRIPLRICDPNYPLLKQAKTVSDLGSQRQHVTRMTKT